MGEQIRSHEDLLVWRKSMDLVVLLYKITEKLPPEERFGLSQQMRRAAVSIPSNIAEGYRRGSKSDYRRFLVIAFGSGAELETQIKIAHRLEYFSKEESEEISRLLSEVMAMLNSLIRKLRS